MKINIVLASQSGSHYHRLLNPMQYMQWATGDSCEMIWIGEDEKRIGCDILYYNKYIATDILVIKEWQKRGMKVVVDVDDLWILPPRHINYSMWTKGGYNNLVTAHIQLADLVICTSIHLQDKVREYNKNTVVIPNAFPYGQENYVPMPIVHDKMVFMYMGGATHLPDVEMLKGKFTRIGSIPQIRDNAEFVLAGYEKGKMKRFHTARDRSEDNQNFTIEECRSDYDSMSAIFLRTGSYRILPTTNLDDYINYYDQADVALCPLVDNHWNSYKSSLKIAEAGVKGIPVICSAVAPYYPELKDCPGILWVYSADDWIAHIKWCINNPVAVKELGKQLAEYCKKNFNLMEWNKVRYELFRKLITG